MSVNPVINECCKDKGNLEVVESNEIKGTTRAIATKSRCKVCGRHHYAIDAEVLDMTGSFDG